MTAGVALDAGTRASKPHYTFAGRMLRVFPVFRFCLFTLHLASESRDQPHCLTQVPIRCALTERRQIRLSAGHELTDPVYVGKVKVARAIHGHVYDGPR